MNIKVGIWIRPFNEREKKLKTPKCVKIDDKKITIKNAKKNKRFSFQYDYCFQSY